jgi:hypothetical protein
MLLPFRQWTEESKHLDYYSHNIPYFSTILHNGKTREANGYTAYSYGFQTQSSIEAIRNYI